MRAVAVLSHLMSEDGVLGVESVARVEKAVEIFKDHQGDLLLTSGWDYRDDSDLEIGRVVSSYLVENFDLDPRHILVDTNSRDTVGDAYFLRRQLCKLEVNQLFVVTSDYHVARTEMIFNAFFEPAISVEVVGAKTKLVDEDEVRTREESSLQAFLSTFEDVDFNCEDDVMRALNTKHPFYNGSIYPMLKCT
tara:strand:+ start:2296 stop:2871 length:576 start_codon:yes stop_codon:yes gene_type:complete